MTASPVGAEQVRLCKRISEGGKVLRELRVHNTLSGKKELLVASGRGHIGMYACGITPYDHCHIGHAMQGVFFDVIRNYLEYVGYQVTYVRNFTDVDDKIIERSAKLGLRPSELAEQMIRASQEDMAALGVRPADHEPRVSESIPEIISMIGEIIAAGGAYATESGDVYYRVRQKADYGKLSNRRIEELLSGTRELVRGDKEHPADFVLWKHDLTEGASWDSPWGWGRPGWHIECSAMARKFLGPTFEIHGGGQDLVFPHHENEIAQSETANGCHYARIWIHSGLLTLNKQKMSKSLGNFITIRGFLRDWPPEVLRLGYLQNHYSSNIDFSNSLFSGCRRRMLYYYETLRDLDDAAEELAGAARPDEELQRQQEAFHRAMCDDFNTVQALGALNALIKQARQVLRKKKNKLSRIAACQLAGMIRELGQILGLFREDPRAFIEAVKDQMLPELNITREEIEATIIQRSQARSRKKLAAQ